MRKRIRRSAKQVGRFNRRVYSNPQGLKIQAVLTVSMADGKSYKATYIFKENGEYLRAQRVDGIKKYYPKYIPLYGKNALNYIVQSLNQ